MPGRTLPRARPHERGVSARRVADFLDAVESGGPEVHSLMVLREGAVVAEGWWEPYRPELVHEMFSVTKSFAATAVGFARAEGRLDLDDLVLDHLRDLAPARPDPRLERMRLRHLLTMTSGHPEGVHAGLFDLADWEGEALALPVENEPGTAFAYSSACTYLLGVAVQRVTGERLLDYLRPRLLDPLGIGEVRWDRSPSGYDNGGFGLWATTEDLARLGLLYLEDGRWDGVQVLPPGWAAEATAHQVDSHIDAVDWAQGYGYGFWRCRHGAVRADGAFGQFSIMFPEQRAVVAITSGTPDLQGVLDLVWEHLLPAVSGTEPLDPADDDALAARLGELRLTPPTRHTSGVDLRGRSVVLDAAPGGLGEVAVTATGPGHAVTALELRSAEGVRTLAVGDGEWARGTLPWAGREHPVAVAGAWREDGVHETHVRWVETPTCGVLTSSVEGDEVRTGTRFTVRFHGPPGLPEVVGRLR